MSVLSRGALDELIALHVLSGKPIQLDALYCMNFSGLKTPEEPEAYPAYQFGLYCEYSAFVRPSESPFVQKTSDNGAELWLNVEGGEIRSHPTKTYWPDGVVRQLIEVGYFLKECEMLILTKLVFDGVLYFEQYQELNNSNLVPESVFAEYVQRNNITFSEGDV